MNIEFVTATVYIEDFNQIETHKCWKNCTIDYLKNEFELKGLRKFNFCHGLQIEHFQKKLFLHQSYINKKP